MEHLPAPDWLARARLRVPEPDPMLEPDGFLVEVEPGTRIHFHDWGTGRSERGGTLLVHGLAGTAWSWAPIARRLAHVCHVAAIDLRGHGLSDAPTRGYEPAQLADDAVAVAEGAGLVGTPDETDGSSPTLVLAGHGFGAIVAAWAARALGPRCGGLVLVDGGWEDLAETTGMTPGEWLRGLDEPPEVLRSMEAFLADRASFDPPSWDADQERAARSQVVELPAGRVVSATRPHALAGCVEAMFSYRPAAVVGTIGVPVVALLADDPEGVRGVALRRLVADRAQAATRGWGPLPTLTAAWPAVGHNLLRYRPAEVAAAVLAVLEPAGAPEAAPAGAEARAPDRVDRRGTDTMDA